MKDQQNNETEAVENSPQSNTEQTDIEIESTPEQAETKSPVPEQPESSEVIQQAPVNTVKHPISKLAVFAMLIALLAMAGCVYLYLELMKLGAGQQQVVMQSQQQLTEQKAELDQLFDNLKSLNQDHLKQQSSELVLQKQELKNALTATEQELRAQIQLALNSRTQVKLNPQEVSSLQRMAEFKAQVERDYQGAAAIFKRLNSLLAEYTGTSELRQAIMQDIQALQSMQPIPVEQIYLTLDGLFQQVMQMPLKMVDLPEPVEQQQETALSENIDDWQQNLKNSWQLLVDDFIKVNQRTEKIEPLLSLEEQTLVRHQLRFYLSQAQTALVQQQAGIYITALEQALQIADDFFDANSTAVTNLKSELAELTAAPVKFAPEITLRSTEQIREWSL